MNRLFPFISVDGADDAIAVYRKAFGFIPFGERTTYGAFDPNTPHKDLIAHAMLLLGDAVLFINDAIEQPLVEQERFTLTLELDTIQAVENSFLVLRENAVKVYYEPMKLPWSDLGYTVKDQFGVIWMVYFKQQ